MTAADPRGLPLPEREDDAGTPLANLIDEGRPPWAWSNLTENEADQLYTSLLWFVATCNDQYAVDPGDVIPACWPAHPRLVHELPVLYWGWWAAHRDTRATPLTALEFYGRHLADFQRRLNSLLGPAVTSCRKGTHTLAASTEASRAVETALQTPQRPPGPAGLARRATFGA